MLLDAVLFLFCFVYFILCFNRVTMLALQLYPVGGSVLVL